ncbi:MAG: methyltransferase domain-containing protein [Rhodospirillaceae bacterium]
METPGKTYSSAITEAHNYSRWVLDAFRGAIGGRVLELGFGHDSYTHILRPIATDYACADIDADAVAAARAKYPDLKISQWDVAEESGVDRLGRGSFDCILCINLLEHVPEDARALANMIDLLAPGGRLLIFVPAFAALYGDMDRMAGHCRRYTRASLGRLIAATPGRIEKIHYFNPLGGLGWWLNTLVRHKDIDSGAINDQIRLFDRYILPLSRLISPLTDRFFGQSLVCVVRKPG